jgi:hypothetical protein
VGATGGATGATLVITSILPDWDDATVARCEGAGCGDACGGASDSVILVWRDPEAATGSIVAAVFARFFTGPAEPEVARGFRVFFSFTSVPVELPVVAAGSLFLRVFFTGACVVLPLPEGLAFPTKFCAFSSARSLLFARLG